MACYSHKQIQQFAANAGFPNKTVSTSSGNIPLLALMSAISTQESNRCDSATGAISSNELSIGIFQINTKAHKTYTPEQLKNPVTNAKEAYRIYSSQGLRAWGAYTDGRYKKYLNDALKAYNGTTITPVIDSNNGNLVVSNTTLPDLANISNNDKAILGIIGLLTLYLIS